MPGARGRLHKAEGSTTPRRSVRRGRNVPKDEEVPAVFQELLHEAQVAEANEDDPPRKRRRTANSQPSRIPAPEAILVQTPLSKPASPLPTRQVIAPVTQHEILSYARMQPRLASETSTDLGVSTNAQVRQTIEDPDESDDESDMEWENALADGEDSDSAEEQKEAARRVEDISIAIGGKKPEDSALRRTIRRRAITSVDKRRRLDIHKMYAMCLMYHVHRRNAWCNDRRVQSGLRNIVSPTILTNLVPNPNITQYSASKQFINGMNELKILWSKRFKLSAQGMYKPRWSDAEADVRPVSDFDDLDDLDDPMDKDDFRNAAYTLRGSQDVGTQLFCALLRGIGIEARLVCSLQPLPFASAAERATSQRASASTKTITVDPYNKPARTGKKLSRLERVMGERHVVLNKTGVAPKKEKAYHTPYPIYWVEAFNAAHQKWVPIDIHSTFTVNAAEKLEPPLSYVHNSLSYAIAFEEDCTAKDVTRRYTKAYSSKTRKSRVECTPGGERWWKRVMKFFERSSTLDRDQIEDATLARKVAAEGMPKNVQDFKGHPVYMLERHLKHNEVIHPLTPVGKVNCGSAMNPKMESIYRRSNVHTVRSADKWYRMGRDVKGGEQPLRHAKPKKGRRLSLSVGAADEQVEQAGAALYAEFQTELYIPPRVARGRVPRNAYGNLDLYVPSMCPPGGTHMRHKLAAKAARILGVDAADAVTGFSFKGRHGTAVIQGVVVAQEYADAVATIIDGLEWQVEEAEIAARRTESLRLWRRFFLGLRIAQRVNAIVIDGETGPRLDVQDEISREDRQIVAQDMAGGFFPEQDDDADTGVRGYSPPVHGYDGGAGGGFLPGVDQDNEPEGGSIPEPHVHATTAMATMTHEHSFESAILDSQALRPRRRASSGNVYSPEDGGEDDEGGEFRPEHYVYDDDSHNRGDGADEQGGGFITEDKTEEEQETRDETSSSRKLVVEKEDTDCTEMTSKSPIPAAVSSPSGSGSLLLEDPEDEDADPDWLVDVT